MFAPTKNHLKQEKVIAKKDGFQLLEKHAIIYLHNWVVANGSVNFEKQIKCLIQSLKSDFDLSPEYTIWQLENDAQSTFENLENLVNRI